MKTSNNKIAEALYWRAKDVATALGITLPTVWRWEKDGILPAPRRIGTAYTVWNKQEIIAFMESKISFATRQANRNNQQQEVKND